MRRTKREKNKALVLDAFDTLFNKRDYVAAECYWSPDYIQHSAHIAPGREGLFNLIKSPPPTLRYEPGTIVADGDFVLVHGRFSHFGLPWIAADILRIKDNILVEHGPAAFFTDLCERVGISWIEILRSLLGCVSQKNR
jgi:predicted SnoaL-like aldol condensation-catalyzing enzyme